jgi:hypothetical protein
MVQAGTLVENVAVRKGLGQGGLDLIFFAPLPHINPIPPLPHTRTASI